MKTEDTEALGRELN